MRISILVGIILFSFQVARPQVYQPVEKYSESDGLSHSWITCLHQDRNGFLWIGTLNGLNRFDGRTFTQYGANFLDSTSLANHAIQKITEDRNGNLWIASSLGISKLSIATNNLVTYYPYSDSALKTLSIKIIDIAIDEERNNMFILTDRALLHMDLFSCQFAAVKEADSLFKINRSYSKLLYNVNDDALIMYSGNSIVSYSITTGMLNEIDISTFKLGINNDEIKGIFCGIGGECWVFTKKRLWQMENSARMKEIPLPDMHSNSYNILEVFQKNPEELGLITTGSVIFYYLQSLSAKEQFQFNLQISSADKVTSCYYMDQGIYWFGTSEGLIKINYHGYPFSIRAYEEYEKIRQQPVFLTYDSLGMLWTASPLGEITVLDPSITIAPKAVKAILNLNVRTTALKKGPTGNILLGTDNGLFELQRSGNKIKKEKIIFDKSVASFCCDFSDTIWVISDKHLYTIIPGIGYNNSYIDLTQMLDSDVIDMKNSGGSLYLLEKYKTIRFSLRNATGSILSLNQLNLKVLPENTCFLPVDPKELIVGTTHGAFIFYLYDFRVLPNLIDADKLIYPIYAMIQDNHQKIWMSTNNGLFSYDRTTNETLRHDLSDGLPWQQYSDRLVAINRTGEICFGGKLSLVFFNPESMFQRHDDFHILLTKAILMGRKGQRLENLLGVDTLVVNTEFTQLLFHFTALDFWAPEKNKFKYSLQRAGSSEEWVDLKAKNSFYLSGLKPGEYMLRIKGTNHNMVWSENTADLYIKISSPVWRSRVAYTVYAAIILALFYLIILFTTRQLRSINRQYKERELIAKKVELQKEELTQKNKNITDSINYAKRIQMALMPSAKLFKKYFSDSFILHIPKDIVSGDFYWINEVDGRIYFAAVDCTGHGVPGAFMSIIGFELFRRITEIEKKKRPAEILNSLSHGFETIFRDIEDITLRDGMDAAFCAIDPELKVLEFSGAFNPLYLVRDNTITEIKGDRFAVGLSHAEDELPPQQFKDNVIPLQENDVIYIFTDGYADQFGGPEGKKYKYRRFRHLLLALHQLPMDRQVEFLRRSIMDWKGNLDQVDDVLVIGIRIHQKDNQKNS